METVVTKHFGGLRREIWKNRRVLLTGHTGFKGAWTAMLLHRLGACVTGVSLAPSGNPNLFDILSPWLNLESEIRDLRDFSALQSIVRKTNPEIVIHMAAQALVKEAYRNPVGTIGTNVMGTINLLECLRAVDDLKGVLVITSDKVYENLETQCAFGENAALGGHDPYSASKAAAEILTRSMQRSFFAERNVPVVTARAGNVIGGGDWAKDRLIPDLIRAYKSGGAVLLRYPEASRPWQHVLDPVYGYLVYVEAFLSAPDELPLALNFGPPAKPVRTVLQIAKTFTNSLESGNLWVLDKKPDAVHEHNYLSIDSALAFETLGWKTSLPVDQALLWACDWYTAYFRGQDMRSFTDKQIDAYADQLQAHAGQAHSQTEYS
jgi:CDP-glucose 4,6-dehydratase